MQHKLSSSAVSLVCQHRFSSVRYCLLPRLKPETLEEQRHVWQDKFLMRESTEREWKNKLAPLQLKNTEVLLKRRPETNFHNLTESTYFLHICNLAIYHSMCILTSIFIFKSTTYFIIQHPAASGQYSITHSAASANFSVYVIIITKSNA